VSKTHHIHMWHHATGTRHDYLVAGSAERAVRGGELFGPITRRVPGPILSVQKLVAVMTNRALAIT
jgi:hypothetical protein